MNQSRSIAPAAAIFAILVVSSCGKRSGRDDARAITNAYRAFQEASVTDRPAALAELTKARCDDAPTCADRDACVDYAKALVRAADLTRRARALAPEDAGGNGAATPDELAVIVSGADDAVKKTEALEPKCRVALERLYAAISR